jgi:hypothetical protein
MTRLNLFFDICCATDTKKCGFYPAVALSRGLAPAICGMKMPSFFGGGAPNVSPVEPPTPPEIESSVKYMARFQHPMLSHR